MDLIPVDPTPLQQQVMNENAVHPNEGCLIIELITPIGSPMSAEAPMSQSNETIDPDARSTSEDEESSTDPQSQEMFPPRGAAHMNPTRMTTP